MMITIPHSLTVLPMVVLLSVFPEAPAKDWPTWRGPDRTNRSPDSGLLKE